MEQEKLVYVDRRNTSCLKWDELKARFGEDDLLPLWIADMDFKAPALVAQRLHELCDHGAFGYYKTPESYYNAFLNWERERHGYAPRREWLRFSPGIVAGINWLVTLLTEPGDGIIVMTPVYYPFFYAVRDHGRTLVESPLVNTDGIYTVDFARFERDITENNIKVFILSSPHNPAGRVWQRDELARMCEICEKHGVVILSDEIHQDLVQTGHKHVPTALVAGKPEKVVTFASASKTFNLAGFGNAFVVIPDDELRERFDAFVKPLHLTSGSIDGYVAAQASFEGGAGWLASLLEQVRENDGIMRAVLAEGLPRAVVSPLEGTYLQWIDLRAYLKPGEEEEMIARRCRLAVDYGDWFGAVGTGFIRVNLATKAEHIRMAAEALVRELGARA